MPLSAKSAINMHLGIGGIITKLGIEKRRNVKHAFKFMTPMVWLTRLLVGAYPQWIGCKPEKIQRIYFANHSSHLDTIVIWSLSLALCVRLPDQLLLVITGKAEFAAELPLTS